MKLQPYQLCRWCDTVLHGRRKWLWLGANVLLLAVTALLGGFVPALSLTLLVNAVLGLYLLHRHHAFGAVYQRTPRPQDAQCETILIDAALIGQGTRLRAAAQPIDVADSLSLRLGSGALLLGTAMTLTADELPTPDRAAILSAVRQLNIKPGRMRSHSPVLRREKEDGLTIVTVRDGLQERRYYLGSPEELAARCPSIWEGHPRTMTEQDHLRIADTTRYIAQGGCRVMAWATSLGDESPVFLGVAGVGEAIHLEAMQDIAALRNQGLTIMLAPGDQPDTDLESLRALLELPDHHARADVHLTTHPLADAAVLGITRQPGKSLLEPVAMLRQHFRTIEQTLQRFGLMLLFSLLMALLCGSWLAPVFLTAMLGYTAIVIGVDLASPRPRWPMLLIPCALALASRFFLAGQSESAFLMAGGMIAVTAALAASLRLGGKGISLRGDSRKATLILLIAAGILLLALPIYGVICGGAFLLPLGFALLISAAVFLLTALEHRIIR